MSAEEQLYLETGRKLKDAVQSQMFGKPCFKINGKAFIAFFENCMVFKLSGDIHAEALNLKGSVLFDPSHKGRPMKEWVQVPYAHAPNWDKYAKAAIAYVASGK
jgi:hypothetical protein